MAFESGLVTYLETVTDLTDIVSTRIHPLIAPQGSAYPYLIYLKVSGSPDHHMTAASALRMDTYQFDCYGTYAQVKSVEGALRGGLDGYRGAMGTETVQLCHLQSVRDSHEPDKIGSAQGNYRVSLDFLIGYDEDVPTF